VGTYFSRRQQNTDAQRAGSNGHGTNAGEPDGKKGLILQFSRSLDWCPYCKAQYKQLIPVAPTIEALGFNIALMTYDSVEKLREIALDDDIKFKLLHDEGVAHVNAFGILNTSYKSGHYAYGVRPDYSIVLDALQKLGH
jgi:peroxiredoxin